MTEIEALNTLHILLAHEKAVDAGELNAPNQIHSQEKEALQFILEEVQQYRAIGTVEQLRFMKSVCDMSDDMLKSLADAVRARMKYEAIGTVEELQALKEKNEPKKVVLQGYAFLCPICQESTLDGIGLRSDYCPKCGQKLDWSE